MKTTRSGGRTAAGAGLVHGLVATAILYGTTSLFGSGPWALAGVVSVWALANLGALRIRSPGISIILIALTFCSFPADVARLLIGVVGYRYAPLLLSILAVSALATLLAPWREHAGHRSAVVGALTLVAGAWCPQGLALLVVGISTLAVARRPAHVPAPVPISILRLSAATVGIHVVLVAWAVLRTPLDPSPLAQTGLFAGALASWGIFVDMPERWRRVVPLAGAGVLLFVGAQATLGRAALLATLPHAGLAVALALGVGAGLVLKASPGRGGLLALALGAALAPLSLDQLPQSGIRALVHGDAANIGHEERVAALAAASTVAWAGVDRGGSAALYEARGRAYVELDGIFVDPQTRQGQGERLAGTLAACVATGRARARIAGDDLGLALEGLRPHGFSAIDVDVPSAGFARALAGRRPALDRAWLDPSVRLLSLPGPFVARAGPPADAVVEIIRAPWATARTAPLDAQAVAVTHRSLAVGGVHVVALSNRFDAPAVRRVLDAFARSYSHPSLWLPPEGADAAIVVGMDAPIPWSALETCVAADPLALRAVALRSALDLGALAMADAASIQGMRLSGRPDPLAFARRAVPAVPALASLPSPTVDPGRLYTGAPETLDERATTRSLFLKMLAEATGGDARSAFEQARSLASMAGGDRAMEPVLRPHLDRARQAIAVAAREGVDSKAWETAEAALANARMLAPNHAATRCLEGELAGGRRDLARAEEAFEACAALDPGSVDAQEGLARARRSRGDVSGTEVALRAALKLAPRSWKASHNLGLFLLDLGRYEEAERLLRQAMATQAETDTTLTATSSALARLYLATDRPELALAQAQRVVELAPSAGALSLRGAARLDLNQASLAEEDFTEALRMDTDHILARYGMGQLHARRGDYVLAVRDFKEVLVQDPRNAGARENLERLAPLLDALQE